MVVCVVVVCVVCVCMVVVCVYGCVYGGVCTVVCAVVCVYVFEIGMTPIKSHSFINKVGRDVYNGQLVTNIKQV